MNEQHQRDDASEVDITEEQIVVEIEHTRADMSGTIDEIGHRLNPQTIASQARDQVREATVGRVERFVEDAGQTAQETSNTVIDTLRQNPVPAALAAIGIGWLAMRARDASSGNGGSRRSDYRYANTPHGYADYATGYGGAGGYRGSGTGYQGVGSGAGYQGGQVVGDRMSEVGDRMSEAGDQLRQRTDEMGQQAQRVADDVAQRSQQALSDAQWQAERAAGQAQRQFDRTLQENPLALGALAIGVGAAVGLAIPETRRERELMGEQRDRLVHQVEQAATEALGQAEQAARETGEQLQEEARQG
ncbi:MAG TPA: DUF3618 domain-containing protein [Candidatus Limnocylindrales bacterium]|nr:DUF3618 domain-containing protein [Candidatus Limnocylindrales bacterium]